MNPLPPFPAETGPGHSLRHWPSIAKIYPPCKNPGRLQSPGHQHAHSFEGKVMSLPEMPLPVNRKSARQLSPGGRSPALTSQAAPAHLKRQQLCPLHQIFLRVEGRILKHLVEQLPEDVSDLRPSLESHPDQVITGQR